MRRRILLTVLALALWLVGTLACFRCDFSHSETFGPELTACSEFPSGPTPERTSKTCGFCCGHQIFTAGGFYTITIQPLAEHFTIESLTVLAQPHLRWVYRPPKA